MNKTVVQQIHLNQIQINNPACNLIGGIYKICGEIGRGFFSFVKIVQDIQTNHQYACKIVPISNVLIGNQTTHFETEIRMIQQLHHPGVGQLYDLIKDSQFYYI